MSDFEKIEQVRRELRISQKEFCDIIGIHPSQYSKIKMGRPGALTKSQILLFLEKFNINQEWFYSGVGNPYKHKLLINKESLKPNLLINKAIASEPIENYGLPSEIKQLQAELIAAQRKIIELQSELLELRGGGNKNAV